MKLVPMRFKGVEWHHNPREISFSCEQSVSEMKAPYGNAYIQNTGRKNTVVRGEGELYGEDCTEQFGRLFSLMKSGGSGVLAIPKLGTMVAVFESLSVKGTPKPDVLTYRFVFREVMEKTANDTPTAYVCQSGETLWDVSYRFGIVIDRLAALNPDIRRPDDVLEGKEVALC